MNKFRIMIFLSFFFGLILCSKAQTYDTLSDFGDYWKYSDKTKLDSIDWKSSTYNDISWNCGPAPLGYGDAWIATCITCGCSTEYYCSHPSTCSVNPTDYFRKKITVTNTKVYDSVKIEGIIDDGIILYINGIQVWNYGLTAPVTYATWSTNNISGAAETTPVSVVIPIDAFVNGSNQVAVELHQRAANTSDATFELRFMFFKHQSTSSGINLLDIGKNLTIYPNPSNGIFTIESKYYSEELYELSFYDLTGRLISTQNETFNNGKTVLNPNLPNGTYIARLNNEKLNSTFIINISK